MSASVSTALLRDAVLIEFDPQNAPSVDFRPALYPHADSGAVPQVYRALEDGRISAYLPVAGNEDPVAAIRRDLIQALGLAVAGSIEICRLRAQVALLGASAGADAPYRYVVRTDVVDGGGAELERWYDAEHMPSLAAVPGTVLAQRMLCVDAPPLYFACYDLIGPEVLRSEPWLDVRATDWSARVRPTFRDTRRILSRRVDCAA